MISIPTLIVFAALALVIYLIFNIRKNLIQSRFEQSLDMENVLTKIQEMNDKYNQQYTDIMSELIEYKGNEVARAEHILELSTQEMFEVAKAAVIEAGKASTSYLQRKLGIGYSRAAQLMDLLEEGEVIGPADGSRPRMVLMEENGEEETA